MIYASVGFSDVETEGRLAYLNNRPQEDNPYAPGTREFPLGNWLARRAGDGAIKPSWAKITGNRISAI